MRRGYWVFGRTENDADQEWWPLFSYDGPLLETSEVEAMNEVRKRLEANGEDNYIELAAVDASAWFTAHGTASVGLVEESNQ